MKKPVKVNINFKILPEKRERFRKACIGMDTSATTVLNECIDKFIKRYEQQAG